MAFDSTFRTTQEYLNLKAGTTGLTKQECLARLSSRALGTNLANTVTAQDCVNTYAGTSGKTVQDALNNKVGATANALTEQEAARRL